MNAAGKKRGREQKDEGHDDPHLGRQESRGATAASRDHDALAVLMSSARRRQRQELAKKRRPGGSFVACPVVGCGKMILESLINVHLDRCVQRADEEGARRRVVSSSPAPRRAAASSNDEESPPPPEEPTPDWNPLASSDNDGNSRYPYGEIPEIKVNGSAATPICSDESPLPSHCVVAQEASGNTASSELSTGHSQLDSSGHPAEPRSGSGIPSTSAELDMPRISLDSLSAEQSIRKCASPPVTALTSSCEKGLIDSSSSSEDVDTNVGNAECLPAQAKSEAIAPVTHPGGSRRRASSGAAGGAPNAFSIMMERSKILSSKRYAASGSAAAADSASHPIQQCLYLSADGSAVTLFDAAVSSARPSAQHHFPIVWSAVVILKDRAVDLVSPVSDETSSKHRFRHARRPVELTIATGMPPSASGSSGIDPLEPAPLSATKASVPQRWVRYHSRLSVPVLKSILQKSIRRRRPLPSVRVAMELADKSLGDLLRRLPVIVMEDSTLHPDMGFLVWLMVAHSKDYDVPRALVARVFQIVFETASCQWKDDEKAWNPGGGPSTTSVADRSHSQDLCLNTLHATTTPADESPATSGVCSSQLLVWSLLVRADYGGMRCDVEMLLRFAGLWQARFRSSGVPADVLRRWGLPSKVSHTREALDDARAPEARGYSWIDVPSLLHERARGRSSERVVPLATAGIQSLLADDISVEGVDFHCSPIVDHLLTLPVAGLCRDLLLLSSGPEEPEENRSVSTVEDALKYCLWHYSSGVNRRQPLIAQQPLLSDHGVIAASQSSASVSKAQPKYEEMWRQLVAEEALRYQVSFVRDRLSRAGHA